MPCAGVRGLRVRHEGPLAPEARADERAHFAAVERELALLR
jgi:hypothetical protein